MMSAGSCLYSCAARGPGPGTAKSIIVLTGSRQYDRALDHLRRKGITPVKAVRGSRMLCLHLHASSDWSRIKRHPHIASFEKDVRIRALGTSRRRAGGAGPGIRLPGASGSRKGSLSLLPWNIRQAGAPAAWLRTLGGGVRLAVIDTGSGPHPDLSIRGGVNVIGGASYRDDNGHGTHVAGIAAGKGRSGGTPGVAPAVSLYAVKALDGEGYGHLSDIIEAIDWCIAKRMHVVNMSFGLSPGSRSKALHGVIRRASRSGIVLVAAAGNMGRDSGGLDLPAAYPQTIAVAASTRKGRIAPFSSRGKGLGLTAPGDRIRSAWLNGKYAVESGTSMSSPHVAGGAALLLATYPGLPPSGAASVLKRWARRLPGYGSRSQGAGLLRLGKIGSFCLPAA
ncbi:S8 family peptidase [Paenibacillus humicus]|uniref:S8 family peptidase n=1 Tax=Paenibacillus humicus TaxID=412861 RepID=UPI003F158884